MKSSRKPIWKRFPCGRPGEELALVEGDITPIVPDHENPEVMIEGRIRKRDGNWIVTLFLVNHQVEPEKNKDEAWLT